MAIATLDADIYMLFSSRQDKAPYEIPKISWLSPVLAKETLLPSPPFDFNEWFAERGPT